MVRRVHKKKDEPYWKDTPEWKRQVNAVLRLKEKGYDEQKIIAVSQFEPMVVRRIFEEEEVNRDLIKQNWEQKEPVMRDIVGMGLNGIKEALKEMVDPEVRRHMVKSVKDLSDLTKVVESINMLLRLEEGKSTANISSKHTHTVKETRNVLQELSKIDPVFDYSGVTNKLPEVVIKDDDGV